MTDKGLFLHFLDEHVVALLFKTTRILQIKTACYRAVLAIRFRDLRFASARHPSGSICCGARARAAPWLPPIRRITGLSQGVLIELASWAEVAGKRET